ncbi:MAG: PQQ-binding-like beta-propeller repeat protein [Burkholderiaceae bacterium]
MNAKIHAVALATLLALVSTAPRAQPMFRGDAARQGVTAEAAPRAFHRVRWTFPTGGRVVSSAVWHDGAVLFGSDDGNVYAVDAASGRQRWMTHTGGPVASTPAVSGGRVFAVSYDGRLYALDARSGEVLWKFATEGERRFEARGLHGLQPRNQTYPDLYDVYLSSPLVVDGKVVFGSGDGHVYAVDAASGRLAWKFATGDVVHASPAYADGLVVVGSWDGKLYALDAASGAQRWAFQAGLDPLMHNQQGFQSSAAIADGSVFVGCRDGHLYAVDLRTGAPKWNVDTEGSWVNASPAVSQGRVYFATSDTAQYRVVDAATGQPAQAMGSTKAYVFGSPTVAGDTVLLGVLNGSVQARDRADGRVLWEFRTEAAKADPGWVLSAEGRFNPGWLYASTWGDLSNDGTRRQDRVGSFYATPLVAGGAVYIGSADGNVYAIE